MNPLIEQFTGTAFALSILLIAMGVGLYVVISGHRAAQAEREPLEFEAAAHRHYYVNDAGTWVCVTCRQNEVTP
jgi:hypothetical protein